MKQCKVCRQFKEQEFFERNNGAKLAAIRKLIKEKINK